LKNKDLKLLETPRYHITFDLSGRTKNAIIIFYYYRFFGPCPAAFLFQERGVQRITEKEIRERMT